LTVAQGVEEEVDVKDARCHRVRGGDGKHFYCLVDIGGGPEFKLAVAMVADKKQPLITNCEGAGEKKRPGFMTTCALSTR
jgi:hypothetical protein